MEDLNDLVFFAKVVEHKGYSEASRQLGVAKSRLSRRVSMLEDRLGVRLLQRTSRRLTVTAVGQLFYERCQAVVSMGEAASEVVRAAVVEPAGALRLSCPITLAQFWLTPLLPAFMKAFPNVKLTLMVTNRRVDPVEEQFDLALRVRRPPFDDSSMVVRRLGHTTDMLVASPAMLAAAERPKIPEDLARCRTLALATGGERHVWVLRRGSDVAEVAHDPRLVCDDMFALRQAAIEGIGVALLPQLICATELREGKLERALPEWGCTPSEIQATFPTRRGMLPAVRALIDFLAAHPPGNACAAEA